VAVSVQRCALASRDPRRTAKSGSVVRVRGVATGDYFDRKWSEESGLKLCRKGRNDEKDVLARRCRQVAFMFTMA